MRDGDHVDESVESEAEEIVDDDSESVADDWQALGQVGIQSIQALHQWEGCVDLEALFRLLQICLLHFQRARSPMHAPPEIFDLLVRPFLREILAGAAGRVSGASDADLRFWGEQDHLQARLVLHTVVVLAHAMLEAYFGGGDATGDSPPDFDGDVLLDFRGPLQALTHLLDPLSPFHQWHQFCTLDSPPPDHVYDFKYAAPPGYESCSDPLSLPSNHDAQHVWAANLMNHFGELGGLQLLERALHMPELLGVEGCSWFMAPLAVAPQLLRQQWGEEAVPAVEKVLGFVESGLTAADGLSVFEEGDTPRANPSPAVGAGGVGGGLGTVGALLGLLRRAETIIQVGGGVGLAASMVCPLRHELLLRLLRSNNFTRQLAAIKELGVHLKRGGECLAGGNPEIMQAALAWMRDQGVVRLLLRQNLHQTQYVEQTQRVLGALLSAGALEDDDLAFLWQLTQDSTTFEGVKANVYGMLGKLAPLLKPEQQHELLSKLERRGRECGVGDSLKLLDLLTTMSRSDPQGVLVEGLVTCLLRILLRRETPLEVVVPGAAAAAEVCCHYDHVSQHRVTELVTDLCLAAWLEEEEGAGAGRAAPAAFVLHALFGSVLQKQSRLDAFLRKYNPNARLLCSTLSAYEAFLRRGAAEGGGGICHEAAVEEWGRLLRCVVLRGNFFLLLNQLTQMLRCAADLAPTPADSSASWELLTDMVLGRKEMTREVAAEFFKGHLCQLAPAVIGTGPAWRCVVAYMAALGNDWDQPLGGGPQDLIKGARLCVDTFEAGMDMLTHVGLDGVGDVAAAARQLLARLLSPSSFTLLKGAEYQTFMEGVVRDHLEDLQCTSATLLPPPPSPAPRQRASPASSAEASQRAQRTLEFLQLLLQEGVGPVAPLTPSHAASYQDIPLKVDLQMPSLQGGPKGGLRISLELPCNSYVSRLRAEAARKLGIPMDRIRLLGGGQEYSNDGVTLAGARVGSCPIMVVASEVPHTSLRGGASTWESSPSVIIQTRLPELYDVALALATTPPLPQPPPHILGNEEMPGRKEAHQAQHAAVPTLHHPPDAEQHHVARAALDLLSCLPTASKARAAAAALTALAEGEGRADVATRLVWAVLGQSKEVVGGGLGDEAEGRLPPYLAGILQYCLQAMCSVAFPNEPLASPTESPTESDTPASSPSPAARLVLSGVLSSLLRTLSALSSCNEQDPLAVAGAHSIMLLLLRHISTTLSAAQQQVETPTPPGSNLVVDGSGPLSMEISSGRSQECPPRSKKVVQERGSSADVVPDPGPPTATTADSAAQPADPATTVHASSVPGGEDESSEAPMQSGASLATLSRQLSQQDIDEVAGGGAATQHSEAQRAELAYAQAALRTLAPDIMRYVLCMLRASLGGFCTPHPPAAADARHLSMTSPGGAELQAQLLRLCEQGLLLLLVMCQDDSSLTLLMTHEPGLPPLLTALLHHPSPPLRGMAGEWLRQFASQSPLSHHWAFSQVVLPLLKGPGGQGDSSSSHAAGEGVGRQGFAQGDGHAAPAEHEELIMLGKHFFAGLDESETPQAMELLRALLQQLDAALESDAPLEGLVTLVHALLRRLDCRDCPLVYGLASSLITRCLFPELLLLESEQNSSDSPSASGSPTPSPACASLAEGWVQVQRAARRGDACRQAVWCLLEDLMLLSEEGWGEGAPLLRRLHSADVFRSRWRNLPISHLRPPGCYAGLRNGGATCYMSSIFQQLFMQPTIRRLVLTSPVVPEAERGDSVFYQLQALFAHLAEGVEPWCDPQGFWGAFKDYDGEPVNIREHQDAYEFFTRLQDCVDEHLKAAGAPPAIHAALGGTFAQLITVTGQPQYRSERDEDFYQVSLDVRGKRTLVESLESYIQRELMDGENQWYCEELGKKVDAEKRTLIKRLPPSLVFHLKRFEWDYESGQRWKVKDRFEFPEQLDMRPFTLEGAEGEAEAGTTPGGHNPQYQYQLRGVVVHSGTAFAGHYYSYIKDRAPGGGWYCFDDTSVEPWDPSQLGVECFGGKYVPEGRTQEYDRPHSAYMLFYEQMQEGPGAGCEERMGAGAGPDAASPADPAVPSPAASSPPSPCPNLAATAPSPMDITPPPAGAAGPPAAAASAEPGEGAAAAAGAASSAAGGGAELAPALLQGVLLSNLREVGLMHLMGVDYQGFISSLSQELRGAINGGKPRKAQRTNPLASPGQGHRGLMGEGGPLPPPDRRTVLAPGGGGSGRGREGRPPSAAPLPSPFTHCTLLVLDYIIRVAARGGREVVLACLAKKGGAPDVCGAVMAAARVPNTGLAVLQYCGCPTTSLPAMECLLCCPHLLVGEELIKLLCCTIQFHKLAESPLILEATRKLVDFMVGDLLPTLPFELGPSWRLKHMLRLLSIVGSQRAGRALLDPHLDQILSLGEMVCASWYQLDEADREHEEWGHDYLDLLSVVIRRFDTSPFRLTQQETDRGLRNALPNPYSLAAVQQLPIPVDVWNFFFSDPRKFRQLLMAGALTPEAGNLLCHLFFENKRALRFGMEGILFHVLKSCCFEDLYQDLDVVVRVVTLDDSLTDMRIEHFLFSVPRARNVAPGLCQLHHHLGVLQQADMADVVLFLRLVVEVYSQAAQVVQELLVQYGKDVPPEQRWTTWARSILAQFRRALVEEQRMVVRWGELQEACPGLDRLVDVRGMGAALAEMARWESASDPEESEDLPEEPGDPSTGGEGSDVDGMGRDLREEGYMEPEESIEDGGEEGGGDSMLSDEHVVGRGRVGGVGRLHEPGSRLVLPLGSGEGEVWEESVEGIQEEMRIRRQGPAVGAAPHMQVHVPAHSPTGNDLDEEVIEIHGDD